MRNTSRNFLLHGSYLRQNADQISNQSLITGSMDCDTETIILAFSSYVTPKR
jgi:hypothetical protein